MKTCSVHTRFFDERCVECKSEYREMKGNVEESNSDKENDRDNKTTVHSNIEKYKEFTEERAKKLYGELLIQYLKKNCNEIEASERAKKIIRKQCSMRGMSSWDWI
jgi:6-phosphogluconolactonase/glucosamine-6-phosphate isomerase/deaminase